MPDDVQCLKLDFVSADSGPRLRRSSFQGRGHKREASEGNRTSPQHFGWTKGTAALSYFLVHQKWSAVRDETTARAQACTGPAGSPAATLAAALSARKEWIDRIFGEDGWADIIQYKRQANSSATSAEVKLKPTGLTPYLGGDLNDMKSLMEGTCLAPHPAECCR